MAKASWKDSLKLRLSARIERLFGNVVLRADIADMADSRQLSRALKALVAEGQLIKIGYGVYAKSYRSPYANYRPVIKGGFDLVCKEALNRLGVRWEPGWAEKAYNEGLSTQVPVNTVVRLKSRFRTCLGYGNKKLIAEKGSNAR